MAIYFDHNASSPIKPEVKNAVLDALDLYGLPMATHQLGQTARRAVEHARRQIASLVKADPEHVVFTSGATESNNTILKGFGVERIITSEIEHSCVIKSAPDADYIPVKEQGVIDLDALENMLKQEAGKTLVSVMMVNNETGVIQPYEEVAKLCKAYKAWFHTDAVQAAGRMPIDMQRLGIDALTLSGHKISGPKGIGAMVLSPDLPVTPLLHGGRQEKLRRGGTENVPGIIGFGVAAELAANGIDSFQQLKILRDKMEQSLQNIAPEIIIAGQDAPRVENTSMIILPGVTSDTQIMTLDLAGICVSAGATCAAGVVAPSRVLTAMNVPEDAACSCIRVSLGWTTTKEDIEKFVAAWENMYRKNKK